MTGDLRLDGREEDNDVDCSVAEESRILSFNMFYNAGWCISDNKLPSQPWVSVTPAHINSPTVPAAATSSILISAHSSTGAIPACGKALNRRQHPSDCPTVAGERQSATKYRWARGADSHPAALITGRCSSRAVWRPCGPRRFGVWTPIITQQRHRGRNR